jgi:hypothetical protein
MRIIRSLALLLVVFLVLAALFALIGSLVALLGWSTYANAIALAMLLGGGLTVFLAAQSGSSAHRAPGSVHELGGRFATGHDIPQPHSPVVLIPAGLLVIGLGALISIATA